MDLYPAIDLRGGRCVRLYQGDYAREAVYGDDPVGQARAFAAEGTRWIHVVDLDAARTGLVHNREAIAAIAAAVAGSGPGAAAQQAGGASGSTDGGAGQAGSMRDNASAEVAAPASAGEGGNAGGVAVQAGGGVRDDESADALLDAGVRRVVVGTAAIEAPDWVRRLAARHPGRVAVGLDARGRDVAVRGWVEGSGRDLVDVARSFADAGVAALIVTEIGRDGTLAGPALDQLAAVLAATQLDVIASGGVGSLDHLRSLAALKVDGRRLAGAIVGRALYEGAFGLRDALTAVEALPLSDQQSPSEQRPQAGASEPARRGGRHGRNERERHDAREAAGRGERAEPRARRDAAAAPDGSQGRWETDEAPEREERSRA